jgi:hypothetical protein
MTTGEIARAEFLEIAQVGRTVSSHSFYIFMSHSCGHKESQ